MCEFQCISRWTLLPTIFSVNISASDYKIKEMLFMKVYLSLSLLVLDMHQPGKKVKSCSHLCRSFVPMKPMGY